MIEKQVTGKVSLVRDPKYADDSATDGRFTLGALEDFCNEARMAGVGTEDKLVPVYVSGKVTSMYFPTNGPLVTTVDGKLVRIKNSPVLVTAAVVFFLLFVITLFFGVL